MLVDLIELFNQGCDDIEGTVFANYKLSGGLYIRIANNGIDESMVIGKEEVVHPEKDWFVKADYYSSLVDMNKPVDPKKKIHSCNYLSVFIKNDVLPEIGAGDKQLTMKELEEAINRYFDALGKSDKKTVQMLEQAHLPSMDTEKATANREWLLENLEGLLEEVKKYPLPPNSYVKMFFQAPMDAYAVEYRRYLIPKIFNNNDYNLQVDGELLGLSNYNMGMNSKKPFLELKSTKFRVPFRVTLDNAIILKSAFEWLKGQEDEKGKNLSNAYIDTEFDFKKGVWNEAAGYYLYFTRGTQTTVEDFDFIPEYEDSIPELFLDNYMECPSVKDEHGTVKWQWEDEYGLVESRSKLHRAVDRLFFNGKLMRNYYTQPKDLPDYKPGEFSKGLENMLLVYRKALHDYFCKGSDLGIKSCIDRMSQRAVHEQIKMASGGFFKASQAFNLRLALVQYFKVEGKEGMIDCIKPLSGKLWEKMYVKRDSVSCDDEKEFFFAAGQLAYYLLSKSKAKDLKQSSAEAFLRAKDAAMVKTRLKDLYASYNHELSLKKDRRFNNIMAAVMGCEGKAQMKDYDDYFLAGFLSKNLFYKAAEQDRTAETEEGANDENE